MTTKKLVFIALGLAALVPASCGRGDGRKPTFPVAGKVLRDNKPVANATVIFHPAGGADPDAVKPRGTTKADGSFAVTTYDGNDGAPAGRYRVTVELWLSSGKGDEGPSNRLSPKFARPDTSGLTAEVAEGPNELKPFELKR